MRYYAMYFKGLLKTGKKNPKRLLTIFPLLIFFAYALVVVLLGVSSQPEIVMETLAQQQWTLLQIVFLSNALYLFMVVAGLFVKPSLGFTVVDTTYILTAPIKPFTAYLFVTTKAFVSTSGIVVMLSAMTFSQITMLIPGYSRLLMWLAVWLFAMFNVVLGSLVGYVEFYLYHAKSHIVSRLFSLVIWLPSVLVGIAGAANMFIPGVSIPFDSIQWLPPLGWQFGLLQAIMANNTAGIVLFVILNILVLVLLCICFVWCARLSFAYNEIEVDNAKKLTARMSKVQKNEDFKWYTKSKKSITHFNGGAIRDLMRIRAGKLWFVSVEFGLKLFIMVLYACLVVFATGQADSALSEVTLSIVVAVCVGAQMFTISKNAGPAFYKDLYIILAPIKMPVKIMSYFIIEIYKMLLLSFIAGVLLVTMSWLLLGYISFIHVLLGMIGVLITSSITLSQSIGIVAILTKKYGSFMRDFLILILSLVNFGVTAGLVFISSTLGLDVMSQSVTVVTFVLGGLLLYVCLNVWVMSIILKHTDINLNEDNSHIGSIV